MRVLLFAILLLIPAHSHAEGLYGRVAETGEIRIGVRTDAAPFSAMADGQPQGFTIELCGLVVDAMFPQQTRIVPVPVTAENRFAALEAGEIDLLCGATTATLEREAVVAFSIPIFETGVGALVAESAPVALAEALLGGRLFEMEAGPVAAAFAGVTVAAHAGTTAEEWVSRDLRRAAPAVIIVTFQDHGEGVEAVRSGAVDAYFADLAILARYDGLRMTPVPVTYEPYALAVPRAEDLFLHRLNVALGAVFGSEAFWSLYERYFGPPGDAARLFYALDPEGQ